MNKICIEMLLTFNNFLFGCFVSCLFVYLLVIVVVVVFFVFFVCFCVVFLHVCFNFQTYTVVYVIRCATIICKHLKP